jgi:hypothetical protein
MKRKNDRVGATKGWAVRMQGCQFDRHSIELNKIKKDRIVDCAGYFEAVRWISKAWP